MSKADQALPDIGGGEPEGIIIDAVLTGIDGRELKIGEKQLPMTIRRACEAALLLGCDQVEPKKSTKLAAYKFAKRLAKVPDRGRYLFSADEVAMIEKYAVPTARVEAYGQLIELIDPGALKETEEP